ncbi:hypothetical protein FG386_003670 [Cryptosporidium ryanae]|uniref:uncharacterized protein n=1 Tax=Cryptosporidium ryanae TaxID=515981 RepID=UPI00351A3C23|nr:hypothetical protein FG386_003670 [Cryptosporidium ryanae]
MVVTISLDKSDGSGSSLGLDELRQILAQGNQGHILSLLDSGSSHDVERLVSQLNVLNASCIGGGLAGYIERARKLLKESKEGINPREGCYPEVPDTVELKVGSEGFKEYEKLGFNELKGVAFVLVAGGLGERLSFEGIKISIKLSVPSNITFFELYASYILDYESRVLHEFGVKVEIPLIIMTSDDTDAKTREFLQENNNFGLKDDQIFLMKQLKVPALMDSDARIALDPRDSCKILTKPHGHGDVHSLLHASGLLSKLKSRGIRYLVFIQDTNALVFNSVLPALGVTSSHDYKMNSLTIPRVPCEPVGALCRLVLPNGSKVTVNTEYNQLDPLLKSSGLGSDFADEKTGYSPFPGNSNVLFIELDNYIETLNRTGGVVPEFVNPKYVDSSKTAFKSPTRLECMMQDIPLLFSDGTKVGCVQMERWATFSPCKNSLAEGRAKVKAGVATDTASTTESEYYASNSQYVRLACIENGVACEIEESGKNPVSGKEDPNSLICPEMIFGIPVRVGAMLVIHPSFASRFSDLLSRIKEGPVFISKSSYVHIEGDVEIHGKFSVDGSVRIIARKGSKIIIKNLVVSNKGTIRYPIAEEDLSSSTNNQKIRGYGIKHEEVRDIISEEGITIVQD